MELITGDVISTIQDMENSSFDMVFADPPDNIGLAYGMFHDDRSLVEYYKDIRLLLLDSIRLAPTVWLSYYWKHDVDIKYIIRNIINQQMPTLKVKTFIWRFTFGQHNSNDCGSGFRFLVRLMRTSGKVRPDNIREMSERQRIGDKRASDKGRVPDDVWDFPRVTGNSYERKAWHPTQHPEALIKRIVLLSTDPGDKVLDLYCGTGTMFRVCKFIDRDCTGIEIDPSYCKNIERELNDSKN